MTDKDLEMEDIVYEFELVGIFFSFAKGKKVEFVKIADELLRQLYGGRLHYHTNKESYLKNNVRIKFCNGSTVSYRECKYCSRFKQLTLIVDDGKFKRSVVVSLYEIKEIRILERVL